MHSTEKLLTPYGRKVLRQIAMQRLFFSIWSLALCIVVIATFAILGGYSSSIGYLSFITERAPQMDTFAFAPLSGFGYKIAFVFHLILLAVIFIVGFGAWLIYSVQFLENEGSPAFRIEHHGTTFFFFLLLAASVFTQNILFLFAAGVQIFHIMIGNYFETYFSRLHKEAGRGFVLASYAQVFILLCATSLPLALMAHPYQWENTSFIDNKALQTALGFIVLYALISRTYIHILFLQLTVHLHLLILSIVKPDAKLGTDGASIESLFQLEQRVCGKRSSFHAWLTEEEKHNFASLNAQEEARILHKATRPRWSFSPFALFGCKSSKKNQDSFSRRL